MDSVMRVVSSLGTRREGILIHGCTKHDTSCDMRLVDIESDYWSSVITSHHIYKRPLIHGYRIVDGLHYWRLFASASYF